MITLALIILTYIAFIAGLWVFRISQHFSLLHPLLSGSALVAIVIAILPVDYANYRDANRIMFELLGPATVALAIPLHNHFHLIQKVVRPLLITLLFGAVFSVAVAELIAILFGATNEILLALTTKSVTTPIALGIAEKTGAQTGLVAGVVIFTGVMGAIIVQPLLRKLNITDERIIGFALGINAHGVGTTKAFEISSQCGAFSSLAMGMTGALTAIVLPWIILIISQ